MTKSENNRISVPVRPDGRWAMDYLSGLATNQWSEWIAQRLNGRDQRVGYRPEEYPESASEIFLRIHDLAEQEGNRKLQDALASAVSVLLGRLDPAGESYWVLRHLIDLAGYTCARGASCHLAGWIEGRRLLDRKDWGIDAADDPGMVLHRLALLSLALVQRRGDQAYASIWKEWFRPFDERRLGPRARYAFIPAAFRGIALAADDVPEKELRQLLRYEQSAQEEGTPVYVSHAVLALFEGNPPRPASFVRDELAAMPWQDEEWLRLVGHTQGTPHQLPVARYAIGGVPSKSRAGDAASETRKRKKPQPRAREGPEPRAGAVWSEPPALCVA